MSKPKLKATCITITEIEDLPATRKRCRADVVYFGVMRGSDRLIGVCAKHAEYIDWLWKRELTEVKDET